MTTCFYCGKDHAFKCDLISAYEFWPSVGDIPGGIRRIEFITFVDTDGIAVSPGSCVPDGTTVH